MSTFTLLPEFVSSCDLSTSSAMRFARAISACEAKIDRVELFRFDVDKPRHFSTGTWKSRSHLAIRLRSGFDGGWGEYIAVRNGDVLDLKVHANPFRDLVGRRLCDALAIIRNARGCWPPSMTEAAEMAMIDLAGRCLGQPSLDLLSLTGRNPVPGVYCILEEQPRRVIEEATYAITQDLKSHVKCKLYGKTQIDHAVVEAVRAVVPLDTYLIGDVNNGYVKHSTDSLAETLSGLHALGLNAVEDPACMLPSDWQDIQRLVGPLDLIVDEPLRGAASAPESMPKDMARIYNIHPGATCSVLDAIDLAKRINSVDAKLMIGDDSLIGPACNAWIQLAIGLGAAWVEAIEKPQECSGFIDCVSQRAVTQVDEGRLALMGSRPGFGLMIDEVAIAQAAKDFFYLSA